MNHKLNRTALFTALAAAIFASCSTAPEPAVKYTDPASQGSVAGTGIESQDISAAAQKAATSIVRLSAIQNAPEPPTILILPVRNSSAAPIDTDLYTTKMRGTLMQFGSGKVQFLARDVSSAANEREQQLREAGAVDDRGTAAKGRVASTYDYILTADVKGISTATSAGQSDYFLVSFQLVDYRDVLVWESQYEIKKEGRESAVYR